MSFFTVSDSISDYVSVDSHGDTVELYTAGTAPPSTTSGNTFSTFVTAPPSFNVADPTTLVPMLDQAMAAMAFRDFATASVDQSAMGNIFSASTHMAHVSSLDQQLQQLETLSAQPETQDESSLPNPIFEAFTAALEPSIATQFRLMLERMETSVGALLVGVNSLASIDSTVRANPSTILSDLAMSRPIAGARRSRPGTIRMNSLSRQIREEMKKLLGRKFMEQNQIVPLDALKSFADLWASQTDITLQPVCCEIDDFRVDLLGSPRSPWNQSASRVFSSHFIQTHSIPANQHHLVQHFFFQRMKSLQAAYRKESANVAAKKAAATAKRRHQRRQSLFTKRVEIAKQHPLLKEHIPVLLQLGISGMSSDESDFEDASSGHVTRYLIHPPIWRNKSLGAWLRVFDSLHILSRRLSANGTRGSFPRLRIESGIDSTRGFVKGLPVTAYDSKWLDSHVAANFNVGQVDEEYSFTHHNQIFSYLRYRNGTM